MPNFQVYCAELQSIVAVFDEYPGVLGNHVLQEVEQHLHLSGYHRASTPQDLTVGAALPDPVASRNVIGCIVVGPPSIGSVIEPWLQSWAVGPGFLLVSLASIAAERLTRWSMMPAVSAVLGYLPNLLIPAHVQNRFFCQFVSALACPATCAIDAAFSEKNLRSSIWTMYLDMIRRVCRQDYVIATAMFHNLLRIQVTPDSRG